MRFFRWMFWLFVIAVLLWFSVSVPLGNRTLLGHIRAIASTPEARDLARGTGEEVRRVKERIEKELRADGGASESPAPPAPSSSAPPPAAPPLDRFDDDDRRGLERLVRDRAAARAQRLAPESVRSAGARREPGQQ